MSHSLASLVKCVRAVAFSPASKLLAAAGDARIIALYDVTSGEQIANLSGHGAWILSLDWSDTGEYLLSGYVFTCSIAISCFGAGAPAIRRLNEPPTT
jgi:superkiller protein 8